MEQFEVNRMGKLSKHLGSGEPLKIDGEEYVLKPLSTEDIPHFFKAMKAFSGAKEGASTEDMLKNINDEGLNSVRHIIDKTLAVSLPDEPEEDRNAFGLKYMSQLLERIFEINSAGVKDVETTKKADVIKRIQQKQQATKDAQSTPPVKV